MSQKAKCPDCGERALSHYEALLVSFEVTYEAEARILDYLPEPEVESSLDSPASTYGCRACGAEDIPEDEESSPLNEACGPRTIGLNRAAPAPL